MPGLNCLLLGKKAHAAVDRIALVMALAAASGGITSTIVSNLVQVLQLNSMYIYFQYIQLIIIRRYWFCRKSKP